MANFFRPSCLALADEIDDARGPSTWRRDGERREIISDERLRGACLWCRLSFAAASCRSRCRSLHSSTPNLRRPPTPHQPATAATMTMKMKY